MFTRSVAFLVSCPVRHTLAQRFSTFLSARITFDHKKNFAGLRHLSDNLSSFRGTLAASSSEHRLKASSLNLAFLFLIP